MYLSLWCLFAFALFKYAQALQLQYIPFALMHPSHKVSKSKILFLIFLSLTDLSGVHLANMSCNCEGLTNGRSRNNRTLRGIYILKVELSDVLVLCQFPRAGHLVADESHHAPLFFFAQISEPVEWLLEKGPFNIFLFLCTHMK